ncbi:hypothetical protein D3C80_1116230 [compost metagenome]
MLPAQAQQAKWHRQRSGQGKAPGVAQPVTDQEADLADQDERQPVLHHGQPLVATRDRRTALVDALVQSLGPADLFGSRLDPHRFKANHLVVLEHRGDVGVDPVVVTALATVLDDAHPWQALLERGPHVREHRRRDIGVAHQVVRCAHQLFAGKTTDLDEGVVAIGDDTLGIGGRDQTLLSWESPFALGYWLVITH